MRESQQQRRIWIGLPEETDRRLSELTDYVLPPANGNGHGNDGDGPAWRKMRQALAAAAFERGLASLEADHGLDGPPEPETDADDGLPEP